VHLRRNCKQHILSATIMVAVLSSMCAAGHAGANGSKPSGDVVNFADQAVGTTSSPQMITISNTNQRSVTIWRFGVSLDAFSYDGPAMPLTLDPSESMSGWVTFTPTAVGAYDATLSFWVKGGATVTFGLSGNGIQNSTLPSITTQPASQTVTVGDSATFMVAATGTTPLSYQWRKNGTPISGATSSSYTSPPSTSSDNGEQFTVEVSNSAGDVSSNSATLTVASTPISVAVTPNNATVMVGSTQGFTANVTGTSNTTVAWSVSGTGCTGAACGTISVDGLYVAPALVPSPATVTVKATSVADPTKSASASLTIMAAAAVLLTISPTSAVVPTSGSQFFTASVSGTSNTAVEWSVTGAGCTGSACGTIASSGSSAVYLAPPVAPDPATVSVTATSVADPTKSASADVTVVPVVVVTVDPAGASVPVGLTQQFAASVTGTSNTAVTWSVAGSGCSGTACGTISASGLYTAPAAVPSPATVTVTATSAADPTKSASADVTVAPTVVVTVDPASASVSVGLTQQFTASVTGTSNTAVTWSVGGSGCSGTACGTISASGLYTAPAAVPSPATVTVTATSAADPTKSGAVDLTIVAAGQVQSQDAVPTISATAKGPNQINLTWSAVSNPGYGYLIWIQSDGDSRYSSYTELVPVPSATGDAAYHNSDPTCQYCFQPRSNGIPPWVVEPQYIDPQDGTAAQYIVFGLKNNTTYNFKVQTYSGYSSPILGAFSNVATATTLNYTLRYVSTAGSDSNGGTNPTTDAWRTILHASQTATSGQMVIIEGGNYTSDRLYAANSGSTGSGNKVVFEANPGDTVTITSSDGSGYPNIWIPSRSSHVVIDNISATANPGTNGVEIDGSYNAWVGGQFAPYGPLIYGGHNLIQGIWTHDSGTNTTDAGSTLAFYGTGAIDNVVQYIHSTRGGHDTGLFKNGADHNRVLNSIFDGGWGIGVAFVATSGTTTGNLVEGNVFFSQGQLVSYYKPAVQVSGDSSTVRRNLIINAKSAGVEISYISTDGGTADLIYNNVIYGAGNVCWWQSTAAAGNFNGTRLSNNICIKSGTANSGHLIYTYTAGDAETFSYNNFLYYSSGVPAPNQAIVDFGWTGTWRTIAYADANFNQWSNNSGLNVDPQFVDDASYDFHLASGSPMLGAGVSVTDVTWGTTGQTNLGAF
jgi:hypothetical protein